LKGYTHGLFAWQASKRPILFYRNQFTLTAWVRARFPYVFGFAPPPIIEEICKHALIEQVFLACRSIPNSVAWEAIPFLCMSSMILFSRDGPTVEVRNSIADAFWQLFLEDPDELAAFQDGCLHKDFDGYFWSAVEYHDGEVFEFSPDDSDFSDDTEG
jgi:hypothetical protein